MATTKALSERELEVLPLIGEGLRNRQIGDRLGIAEKTVETHITRILRKTKLQSRYELIIQLVSKGEDYANSLRPNEEMVTTKTLSHQNGETKTQNHTSPNESRQATNASLRNAAP